MSRPVKTSRKDEVINRMRSTIKSSNKLLDEIIVMIDNQDIKLPSNINEMKDSIITGIELLQATIDFFDALPKNTIIDKDLLEHYNNQDIHIEFAIRGWAKAIRMWLLYESGANFFSH